MSSFISKTPATITPQRLVTREVTSSPSLHEPENIIENESYLFGTDKLSLPDPSAVTRSQSFPNIKKTVSKKITQSAGSPSDVTKLSIAVYASPAPSPVSPPVKSPTVSPKSKWQYEKASSSSKYRVWAEIANFFTRTATYVSEYALIGAFIGSFTPFPFVGTAVGAAAGAFAGFLFGIIVSAASIVLKPFMSKTVHYLKNNYVKDSKNKFSQIKAENESSKKIKKLGTLMSCYEKRSLNYIRIMSQYHALSCQENRTEKENLEFAKFKYLLSQSSSSHDYKLCTLWQELILKKDKAKQASVSRKVQGLQKNLSKFGLSMEEVSEFVEAKMIYEIAEGKEVEGLNLNQMVSDFSSEFDLEFSEYPVLTKKEQIISKEITQKFTKSKFKTSFLDEEKKDPEIESDISPMIISSQLYWQRTQNSQNLSYNVVRCPSAISANAIGSSDPNLKHAFPPNLMAASIFFPAFSIASVAISGSQNKYVGKLRKFLSDPKVLAANATMGTAFFIVEFIPAVAHVFHGLHSMSALSYVLSNVVHDYKEKYIAKNDIEIKKKFLDFKGISDFVPKEKIDENYDHIFTDLARAVRHDITKNIPGYLDIMVNLKTKLQKTQETYAKKFSSLDEKIKKLKNSIVQFDSKSKEYKAITAKINKLQSKNDMLMNLYFKEKDDLRNAFQYATEYIKNAQYFISNYNQIIQTISATDPIPIEIEPSTVLSNDSQRNFRNSISYEDHN